MKPKTSNFKEVIEERTHYSRDNSIEKIKCGIQKKSMRIYGTNFGYSATNKIEDVTCKLCLRRLRR